MSDGTYRGRWIDEVLKTNLVSPEVKVLLFAMSQRMNDAGHYSVPRDELAAALGCHPRKVTEKQGAAIAAGLLVRTAAGHRGKTAEFAARVPDGPERVPTVGTQTGERVPTTSTLSPEAKGADSRPPMSRKGADARHPNPEKGCRQSAPQVLSEATDVVHDDGARVIELFEDKMTTSLRSKKHTAREREEPASSEDPLFAEFWKTYPKRVAKGAARKAWVKAIKNGANAEAIIFGARRYATDPGRVEAEPKYTAHPASWLNAERWEDEPDPAWSPTTTVAPVDRRQQATNDKYERAMQRAAAREEGTL